MDEQESLYPNLKKGDNFCLQQVSKYLSSNLEEE